MAVKVSPSKESTSLFVKPGRRAKYVKKTTDAALKAIADKRTRLFEFLNGQEVYMYTVADHTYLKLFNGSESGGLVVGWLRVEPEPFFGQLELTFRPILDLDKHKVSEETRRHINALIANANNLEGAWGDFDTIRENDGLYQVDGLPFLDGVVDATPDAVASESLADTEPMDLKEFDGKLVFTYKKAYPEIDVVMLESPEYMVYDKSYRDHLRDKNQNTFFVLGKLKMVDCKIEFMPAAHSGISDGLAMAYQQYTVATAGVPCMEPLPHETHIRRLKHMLECIIQTVDKLNKGKGPWTSISQITEKTSRLYFITSEIDPIPSYMLPGTVFRYPGIVPGRSCRPSLMQYIDGKDLYLWQRQLDSGDLFLVTIGPPHGGDDGPYQIGTLRLVEPNPDEIWHVDAQFTIPSCFKSLYVQKTTAAALVGGIRKSIQLAAEMLNKGKGPWVNEKYVKKHGGCLYISTNIETINDLPPLTDGARFLIDMPVPDNVTVVDGGGGVVVGEGGGGGAEYIGPSGVFGAASTGDGVAAGDRVLVRGLTGESRNGIYTAEVASCGISSEDGIVLNKDNLKTGDKKMSTIVSEFSLNPEAVTKTEILTALDGMYVYTYITDLEKDHPVTHVKLHPTKDVDGQHRSCGGPEWKGQCVGQLRIDATAKEMTLIFVPDVVVVGPHIANEVFPIINKVVHLANRADGPWGVLEYIKNNHGELTTSHLDPIRWRGGSGTASTSDGGGGGHCTAHDEKIPVAEFLAMYATRVRELYVIEITSRFDNVYGGPDTRQLMFELVDLTQQAVAFIVARRPKVHHYLEAAAGSVTLDYVKKSDVDKVIEGTKARVDAFIDEFLLLKQLVFKHGPLEFQRIPMSTELASGVPPHTCGRGQGGMHWYGCQNPQAPGPQGFNPFVMGPQYRPMPPQAPPSNPATNNDDFIARVNRVAKKK